jgi:endoglucanase
MRSKIFFIAYLISICTYAQVIYSDAFDLGINNFTSSASLNTSLNNNKLILIGNGNAGAWENLTYAFHNNGTNEMLDASSNPKVYIKIKAENTPEVRVDFIDINGYVTNESPTSVYANSNFQIFELDYTGKFTDGGYGGPCTPGPCNVDSTQLTGLMFFINPGVGSYNGEIEIKWISIGEPLETEVDYDIRYNQLGYFPSQSKYINLLSASNFSPKNFEVLDADNNLVMSGTSESVNFWNDSGEYVSRVDLSSITTPGTYQFKTDELEINFKIGTDIYALLSEASLKYYYFNRASTSISTAYGGVYSRNIGHPDDQVFVHSSAASANRPAGTIISSPKGWYDAGDYNKYIVNSGISTFTLLAAFEHYTNYYTSKIIDIPESNGNLPDILAEIKWNLDWMISMQDPSDGGVYHKLTGLNFSGIVMPENYNLDRYVVGKSTTAALNFAAVMAVAARVYADYETELPGYSSALLNASESAYLWAQQNPTQYFTNPSDVFTGEYGDTNVLDEFRWAATELFISTGNTVYGNAINISAMGNGTASWQYTDPLALMSILHHNSIFSSTVVSSAGNLLLNTANSIKNHVENSVMNTAMGETSSDYIWGSNANAANKIMILIRAYEFTNDSSFLNAAYTAMDYLLGRNATGYSYVTGFGDKPPLNPHHRISEADQVTEPIPGMLVGGPNPAQQDGCSGYISNSNAGSYVDDWCSYASNEVTINWNAPLAYVVNALEYYENGVSLSNIDFQLRNDETIIHPNPTQGILNITSPVKIKSVSLYTITGKTAYSGHSNIIDVSNLKSGLYFVKVQTTDSKFYVTKILKE